jgi:hypothetical protein
MEVKEQFKYKGKLYEITDGEIVKGDVVRYRIGTHPDYPFSIRRCLGFDMHGYVIVYKEPNPMSVHKSLCTKLKKVDLK